MQNKRKNVICNDNFDADAYKDDPDWFADASIEFTPDQAREWQKQAQIYAKQFKLNIQNH